MKTRIHVNQQIIRANKHKLEPAHDAPLTVKDYKQNRKAFEAHVSGPCTVVYRPRDPLPCGAKVWIETESEVITLENIEYSG